MDNEAISSNDVRQFIDELERRFGLGDWGWGWHADTLMTDSSNHPLWGSAAGTAEATISHAASSAMFLAGCENRYLGDERWLAAAIWINGLRGVSPQDVMADLPSWRTADL